MIDIIECFRSLFTLSVSYRDSCVISFNIALQSITDTNKKHDCASDGQ